MRKLSFLVGALALVACSPQIPNPTAAAQAPQATQPTQSTQPTQPASREGAYPLDARDRSAPKNGTLRCSPGELVTYRGVGIPYSAPAQVHPSFTARLERFEGIASEVGVEVYGRAPTTLHHGGAYSCRTMPSGRYSEHAFGNALDLEGFSFAAADGRPALRIHVREAWRNDGSADAKRFFARLLERLEERDDVFRAIVGPPAETHEDHLHLDMGPWAYSRYAPPVRS